jgi:hypothetical protein
MRVAAFAAAAGVAAAMHATLLSPAPAGYPVPFLVNGTAAFATLESPTPDGTRRIVLLSRNASAEEGPWDFVSVVVEDATPGVDLANCYCVQLPGPAADAAAVVCAYRHHLPGAGGAGTTYRIRATRSTDGGATWAAPVTVTEGPVGVWEPFLYVAPQPAAGAAGAAGAGAAGVAAPPLLRMLYSAELTNGGEQDVVQQDSADGGLTWSAVTARVHTAGSRNGMPGVAPLSDGSLLMVLEGFWAGVWGWFTVNSVRSFDGGDTWVQPVVVFQPPSGCNAGAPKVGLCALTNKINVVFMTNDGGGGGGGCPGGSGGWPNDAALGLRAGFLSADNTSAPLNFTGAPVAHIPTVATTALWPALFVDVQNNGAGAAGGGGGGGNAADSMRVAYQSADGAYLTDGTLCLS